MAKSLCSWQKALSVDLHRELIQVKLVQRGQRVKKIFFKTI